jgi:hypothetical protein
VTGIPSYTPCLPILPTTPADGLPFELPPHPATPHWSHNRFTIHEKPKVRAGWELAKWALLGAQDDVYKIWVMVAKSHASDCLLALYCIFIDNRPFISDYTPVESPGGLMLALLLALQRLRPHHDVLVFFQDALFPICFLRPSSPFLGPVTRAIDDYLTESPSSTITGFWADHSWAWPGQTKWWIPLIEKEFHSSLDSIPKVAPSRLHMFLEWATDWVSLNWNDYR